MNAKESIWIAGWMISPELCLKRPVILHEVVKGKNHKGEPIRLLDILEYKVNM
jgi:hypothetical protein